MVALQNIISSCRCRSVSHNFHVDFMKIEGIDLEDQIYEGKNCIFFPYYPAEYCIYPFILTTYFLNISCIFQGLEKYILQVFECS